MSRSRILVFGLSIVVLSFFAAWAPAQTPPPRPGYTLVDDMYLPDWVLITDSAYDATPWSYNVVPYAFNANVDSTKQLQALKAMSDIAAVTFVIFVPRTVEANWVVFNDSNVNNSYVGMIGGGQTINIADWNIKFKIVHELFHALGYEHEQCRPDRDTYVTINVGNIQNGQVHNFYIAPGATMPTPYDFLSIMHYPRDAFSSNGLDTITCNPGYSTYENQIGNRSYMTINDALGLQARYSGSGTWPTLTSIAPTSVSTTSGAFTVHAYGSSFFEGSLNGSGVIGTQITWNGTPLPTTFVDFTHIMAQVPASYVSQPQVAQVGVINPYPGVGGGLNTFPLSSVCNSSVLALQQSVPATVTSSCQQFSIAPAYNTSDVVAVSSPSSWGVTMGSGTAATGGGSCNFVVGSGFYGAGTITPTTGNLTWQSGANPATVEYVVATPLNTGQPTIGSLPAGSIARAFYLSPSANSTRRIDVAGPVTLRWKLLWGGNSFGWRSSSSSYVVAQGQCGIGPTGGFQVGPSPYTLVIYKDGGPAATSYNFTINEGFDFTPITLTPANDPIAVNQGPQADQPFTIIPQAGHWNVVGVSSPSDWDIQIGPAVSQSGGSSTDYVLVDAHFASFTPLTGAVSPYVSPGSNAALQFAPIGTISSVPGSALHYTSMMCCFEVNLPAPGAYSFSVSTTGGTGWAWDLHAPTIGANWTSRSHALSQSNPVNVAPITFTGLGGGWHCVVLRHDGGQGVTILPSLTVTPGPVAPALASLSPSNAPANSGTFDMTVSGSSFTPSSQVRWNGSAIPTTYVDAATLTGHVDNSLIPAPGSASITVSDLGGVSNAVTFSITNPVPFVSSVLPTPVPTGSPSLTISVYGSNFIPGTVVYLDQSPIPTTYVNGSRLDAYVESSYVEYQTSRLVTAVTPAPGGGSAGWDWLIVLDPVLNLVTPAQMAALPPGSAPFPVTIVGDEFTPYSVVYANDVALPTTFVDQQNLTATLDPALVPQTGVPGAMGIAIVNTPSSTSFMLPIVVGTGNNGLGLIRTQPIAPAPGTTCSLRVEHGVPNAPLTMIADLGNPTPFEGFPDGTVNFVLGVTEAAGSNGAWFTVVDGLGLFGPPDGSAFDANGNFEIPNILLPNPALGVSVVIQAAYVDPGSPLGVTLTWPVWSLHI